MKVQSWCVIVALKFCQNYVFAPLIKGERGIFGIKHLLSLYQIRGKSPVPPLSRGRMSVIPICWNQLRHRISQILGCIVMACLLTSNLYAQKQSRTSQPNIPNAILPLKRIPTTADAPQSLITSILRDKRGFMWFASETGLYRYDGRTFVQYRPFPDKPSFDNAITALQCDSSGRLWLGTSTGLFTFDRRTERVIPCSEVPANLSITALASDAVGNVFAAANDTLYTLQAASQLIVKKTALGSMINALSVMQTPQGAWLLAGTERGLLRFLLKNNTLFLTDTLFANTSISAVLGLNDGAIVCGTASNGVRVYQSVSKQIRAILTGTHRVLSLEQDARGVVWCGTAGGGVWSWSNASPNNAPERSNDGALRGHFVTALYRDVENIVWFGASDGALYNSDPHAQTFTFISPDSRVIPDAASLLTLCIYEDSEHIVWLGTQRGLLSYNPASKQWSVFRHNKADKNSISSDNISCLYEDARGTLWIGTTAGGLNAFDRRTRHFTAFKHDERDSTSLSSNNVSCLYEDSRGRMWVGTWINGLNLFDRESLTFTKYRSNPQKISTLSSNSISYIGEDRMIADGTLWIGTYEDGLNAFHPTIQAFTRHLYNPHNVRSINSNAISAMTELSDGTLWITTDAGLNKFDRQTQVFTRYDAANGLPSEALSGVVGDKRGNIWLMTANAICRFNPRTSEARVYDAEDGVTSNGEASSAIGVINNSVQGQAQSSEQNFVQFSSRAYHLAGDGTVYFGANAGFVRFHPDSVRENGFVLPVVITALKKFNNVVNLPISITEADEIELWYTDNFISFEFAALGFSFSHKNRFRYKLDGFDNTWIDAGSKNEAVYTNLDGGEYVFRVKACNSDGVWNEQGRALRVIVHPPFWRTRWFYAVSGILLIGGVWSAFRWRVRNLRIRTDQLERLVNERTSQLQHSYQELAVEKHRTEEQAQEVLRVNTILNEHNAELAQQTRAAQLEMLRYQLNPHFLFNALISISDLIGENPKHATRAMTTLMAYLRYALQPAGLPTTPLAEELKALRSYLTIEQVRFEERLRVHFDIDLAAEDVLVPSFLLQPLVENAVKYGMRTSAMPLSIWVSAHLHNDAPMPHLTLEVVNSGSLHFPDNAPKPEGTGTGLKNIRERLQVLFPDAHEFSLFEENGKVYVRILVRV